MRNRRYNFRGTQDPITLAHIVSTMDSVSSSAPQFLMGVTDITELWKKGAYLQMGNRAKGDAVPSWAAASLTNANAGVGGVVDINDPVNGVLHRWWNAVNAWAVIFPHSTNTNTNGAVSIFDTQLYVLLTSTGKWTRIDNGNGSFPFVFPYYNTDTGAWQQAGSWFNDPLYSRQATAVVRTAGDRGSAATIPGDEAKFSYAHNTLTGWKSIDGSDVAGVFATCKARLFSLSGALNGTPKIMMDIGVDFAPETTSVLNTGELAGLTYWPGSGGSNWIQLPNDGSIQRISFCTVGGTGFNTMLDNANDGTWSAANRVYLTYDEISAKLPVLIFN